MIYHIAQREDWQAAQLTGLYVPGCFQQDGFIHCSKRAQLQAVAERYFHGVSDLILLTIDPMRLEAELRYEDVDQTGDCYPHLYGPLNLEAVVRSASLGLDREGKMPLPAQDLLSEDS